MANNVSNTPGQYGSRLRGQIFHVQDIPFITEDTEELQLNLFKFFHEQTRESVETVICDLKGDKTRAIVKFGHTVDCDETYTFEETTIRITPVPQVYDHITAHMHPFYLKRAISKSKQKNLKKAINKIAKTIDCLTIVGTLNEIQKVMESIESTLGIKPDWHKDLIFDDRRPSLFRSAVSNAILVQDIPYLTDDPGDLADKLEIHFQSSSNGGGEVVQIICPFGPNMESALIVFASANTRETVMSHTEHTLDETKLQIQELPPIYQNIEVQIPQFYIDLIPLKRLKQLQPLIGKNPKVKFLETNSSYVLNGEPAAVRDAVDIMLAEKKFLVSGVHVTGTKQERDEFISSVYAGGKSEVKHDSGKEKSTDKGGFHKQQTAGECVPTFRDKSGTCNAKYFEQTTTTAGEIGKEEQEIRRLQLPNYDSTVDSRRTNGTHEINRAVHEAQRRATDIPDENKNLIRGKGTIHQAKTQTTAICSTISDTKPVDKSGSAYHNKGLSAAVNPSWKNGNNHKGIFEETEDLEHGYEVIYPRNMSHQPTDRKDVIPDSKSANCPISGSSHAMAQDVSYKSGMDTSFARDILEQPHGNNETESTRATIAVNEGIYLYIDDVYKKEVDDILRRHNVSINFTNKDIDQNQGYILEVKGVRKSNVEGATSEIQSLYENIYYSTVHQSLNIDNVDSSKLNDAFISTKEKFSTIHIRELNRRSFSFVGQIGDDELIHEAVKHFRSEAGIRQKRRGLKKQITPSKIYEDIAPKKIMPEHHHTKQLVLNQSTFFTDEGLEVLIATGDITEQPTDVIVNAANGRLSHGGGVAAAIAKAAGYELTQECDSIMQTRGPIPAAQCVHTEGYNLKCRYVIHAVGPDLRRQGMTPSNFKHLLQETFLNCFRYCNNILSQSSIAVPLISSGIFGGSKDDCASILARAVMEFSETETSRKLHKVYLINIDDESTTKITGAFHSCLSVNTAKSHHISDTANTSSRLPCSFQINDEIKAIVLQGDLTKQKVDVVVNAANAQLAHDGGVAGSLSKAAGPKLQSVCSSIILERGGVPLHIGEIVETSGFNLPCPHVIHTVGPVFADMSPQTFRKHLKEVFMTCLNKVNSMMAKTVAIPLISSGIYGGPKEVCAEELASAIIDFGKSVKSAVLRTIYLINIDEDSTECIRRALSDRLISTDTPLKPTLSESHTLKSQFQMEDGLQVLIETGDVTKQHVGAIVNAVTRKLRHKRSLAKAISDTAGKGLQKECNDIMFKRSNKLLEVGSIEVGRGHKLPCKHVLHTVFPRRRKYASIGEFTSKLQKTFFLCLQFANTNLGVKSLAIPLIGARDSGENVDNCSQALIYSIECFCKIRKKKELQKLLLTNVDDELTTVLKVAFNDRFRLNGPETQTERSRMPDAQRSSILPLIPSAASTPPSRPAPPRPLPLYQTLPMVRSPTTIMPDGLLIYIFEGDITKQNASAIVNSTDVRLLFDGGVSKAISRAAGSRLQRECQAELQKHDKQCLKTGDIITTSGGNLSCLDVIHAVTPIRTQYHSLHEFQVALYSLFVDILNCANDELGSSEVALPLIGSGTSGGGRHICADILAGAISSFSSSRKEILVKHILLVNIEKETTQILRESFSHLFHTRDEVDTVAKEISMTKLGTSADTCTSLPSFSQSNGASTSALKVVNTPGSSARTSGSKLYQQSDIVTASPSGTSNYGIHRYCGLCGRDKEIAELVICGDKMCFDCMYNSVLNSRMCPKCKRKIFGVFYAACNGLMAFYVDYKLGSPEGSYVITYYVPSGIQKAATHHVGKPYDGMTKITYLPNTREGSHLLELFKKAFTAGAICCIVPTPTSKDYVDLSPGIPHKFCVWGTYEHPDPYYFRNATTALNRIGISLSETRI